MQIRVLYFGALRDAGGISEEALMLDEGSTAMDVLVDASRRTPQMDALLRRSAVAVNQHYALPSTVLKDGDEVALLPPVSGGACFVV